MNTTFEQKQIPMQISVCHESQSIKDYPSRTIVHAKLEMTEPGDHDEREADAAAHEVMSGKVCRKISGGSAGGGIAVSSQMESQLNHLRGGGQTMPDSLRGMMERGFDRDFSQVRLHTDSEAAGLSSSINAKAFTHGNDIYFNRGQFSPETSEGQHLVAHELTHVVQSEGKIGRWFTFNQPQDNTIDTDDANEYQGNRQITDKKQQDILKNHQWRALKMLEKCIRVTRNEKEVEEYRFFYDKYFPIEQLSIVHENYKKIRNVIRNKKVNISHSEAPIIDDMKWDAYVQPYDMRQKTDANGIPKKTDGYNIVIDKDVYDYSYDEGAKVLIHELAHEELLANSKPELSNYDTEYYSDLYEQPACLVKSNDEECTMHIADIVNNNKSISCVNENDEGCTVMTNIEDVKKLMCCGESDYAMNNAENYARFAYDLWVFDFS